MEPPAHCKEKQPIDDGDGTQVAQQNGEQTWHCHPSRDYRLQICKKGD
jgi:hypothetical protein